MARKGGENVGGTDAQNNVEGEIIFQKEGRNKHVQDVWTMWRWGSEAGEEE
jgi:hypothetical protein